MFSGGNLLCLNVFTVFRCSVFHRVWCSSFILTRFKKRPFISKLPATVIKTIKIPAEYSKSETWVEMSFTVGLETPGHCHTCFLLVTPQSFNFVFYFKEVIMSWFFWRYLRIWCCYEEEALGWNSGELIYPSLPAS